LTLRLSFANLSLSLSLCTFFLRRNLERPGPHKIEIIISQNSITIRDQAGGMDKAAIERWARIGTRKERPVQAEADEGIGQKTRGRIGRFGFGSKGNITAVEGEGVKLYANSIVVCLFVLTAAGFRLAESITLVTKGYYSLSSLFHIGSFIYSVCDCLCSGRLGGVILGEIEREGTTGEMGSASFLFN
jgi:hypothetical protein